MKMSQSDNPKGVLLAIDGSLSAKSAVYAAIRIASAMKWSLHAQYVVDPTQVFDFYGNTTEELKELGNDLPKERHISLFEEEGTLALVEIKDIGREMGTAVTTEMIFGGIPEIILESAKQSNLLALGRRGNRHEKHSQHLGSNFRQIEHHAHIPLLIGGSEPTQEELNRVLLAYNGNDLSRSALNWVEGLQTIFTDIIVLSVKTKNEPGSAWLEKRQEEISKSTLGHWDFVGMEGEPGPIITSTALARQADLIVMGAYRHRQLIEWASHRTLNYVLSNIDLPIMAIK